MNKVKRTLKHINIKVKRGGIHAVILILLIILLVTIVVLLFPIIVDSIKLNHDLQEPRNFHVSFDGRYNKSIKVDPNILVDLNITHSNLGHRNSSNY